MEPIIPYLIPTFKDTFLPELTNQLYERFNHVSNRELKDFDASLSLEVLRKIALFDLEPNGIQINEEAELRFILKMLRSPILEKRIKAINEMKDLPIRTVEYPSSQRDQK